MLLSIVNNLGGQYRDADVYFGIIGYLHNTTLNCDQLAYLHADNSFQVAKPKTSGSNPSYQDTVYFFQFDANKKIALSAPIVSGRCWISLGAPLTIPIAPEGFQGPGFNDQGDPNYSIIYDKFEFTLLDSGVNCNTTCADFFSIPLTLSLSSNEKTVVGVNSTQKDVFETFRSTDFATLVIDGLRVLNPTKVNPFESSVFATYFDQYTDACWSFYTQANPLEIPVDGGAAVGAPDTHGDLVFLFSNQSYSIPKPTSSNVFGCDGVFNPNAKDSIDGEIKRQVAAAMNRGVFLNDVTSWCDATKFYVNKPHNIYSKILHDKSVAGNCYGFPWDDVCNHYSTDIAGPSSDTLTVTLGALE